MATAPLSNLTATWNASGTTFTAVKMNVTDTASAAASLLLDLQVGGTSQAKISKGGVLTTLGRASINTLTIGLGGQTAVSSNTALGFEALHSASLTGTNNVGVGYRALVAATSGVANTAVGVNALASVTTPNNNTAVGSSALHYFNTGGNTAVGINAARGSTTVGNNTGSNLTAIGVQALQNNTSGENNAAAGLQALISNTTGGDNSAVGTYSLFANTTGGSNCALGTYSLYANTTGGGNVAIGKGAGDNITTGSRNTIVGGSSDASAVDGNDQTVIGEGLTGKGNDTAFLGGTNGAYNEKNVTTWETTSDARIKKNIADFNDGLSVIEALRVRTFEYRTPEEITELPQSAAIDRAGVQLGVIAQEIQQVLPECVTQNSTGVLSVSTDPLVWHLVNAVKQLSAEIKALKRE
jgi:hypothetical protein